MIRPVLAFCLLAACCGSPAMAEQPRPNIVFIAIDDLNDWVGCLDGHPQVQTPNIDRLAARGTLFSSAHCQSPLCNPSRTSVLTGLRPSTTGVYGLAPWFRRVPELKAIVSLPQYLRDHGYKTYSAGKIYHGGYGRSIQDNEFDVLGPGTQVKARPKQKLVDTPSGHPLVDWGEFDHRDEDKGDWDVASWAVKELESEPQEPFFLSVGFFLPHVPCYASPKWFELYPEATTELPPVQANDRADTPRASWYLHWKLPEPRLKFLIEADQWNNHVRSYLACVSFVDSQVGRVLDALEQSGQADNTIVVLWSDHGYHIGEKEITGKNTLWEPSTRVPLMFAGPGVAAEADCRQPVELLDIYPTLLELAGLPPREELEGQSLAPQLKDAAAQRERPAITTHNHDNHAIRSERWRYIRYVDGAEELYDMQADPHEFHNIIDDERHADVVAAHRKWLPEKSAPPAPGSAHRILIHRDGKITWEGKRIAPDDAIPER